MTPPRGSQDASRTAQDGFYLHFGRQLGAKLEPCWPLFPPKTPQDAPKTPQDAPRTVTWSQKGSKIGFLSIFDRFGMDFGSIFGRLFIDFWTILAPFWEPSWSHVGHLFRAKTRPRRPKTPPEPPKTPKMTPKWSQVGTKNG